MAQTLIISQLGDIDPRTVEVYNSHHLTKGWIPTQYWRWDGGDAIVTLNGQDVTAAIRIGNRFEVVLANGLKHALTRIGEDPTTYEVL